MTLTLRPYQSKDLASAVVALHEYCSAIGIAATGLGKAVVIAKLAEHYVNVERKRVLILADMGVLVDQLAETVEAWTGIKPAIEKAEQTSEVSSWARKPPIVVGTVQTQYSKRNGKPRYRRWEPGEFGLVIMDEAEISLAPEYQSVLRHHSDGTHLFGCTATPMRGDGEALGQLYRTVAFNRDIRWGVENGYLVPPRQGFVDVALDFARLKTSGGDYTDASVAAMLRDLDERKGLEFAHGVLEQSGDKQGIVVAPHVRSCKAISDYVNAISPGASRVIYGDMEEQDKRDTLYAFKAGMFPLLVSVNMLTKGFDHAGVHNVFMCRPTRSKRLYTQVLGRGTRLCDPAIGALVDADSRRAAIAASDKPLMTMYNMVGINADVRDLTIGDVLGGDMTANQRAAVSRRIADGQDSLDDIDDAKDEGAQLDAEIDARARERIESKARVKVEFSDPLSAMRSPDFAQRPVTPPGYLPKKTMATLKKFRIPNAQIARMTQDEAGEVARQCIARARSGLCSLKQAAFLRGHGVDASGMKKAEASRRISEILDRQG